MESLSQWKVEIRSALVELEAVFEGRSGYPIDPDANFINEPEQGFQAGEDWTVFPPALARFYAEVGEIALPDIHIGYFIHPASRLPVSADWGLPTRVEWGIQQDVATFGSDGGGGLFLYRSERRLCLPTTTGRN